MFVVNVVVIVVRLATDGEKTLGHLLWVLVCFEDEKKREESFGRRQLQPMSTTIGCLTWNFRSTDNKGSGGLRMWRKMEMMLTIMIQMFNLRQIDEDRFSKM